MAKRCVASFVANVGDVELFCHEGEVYDDYHPAVLAHPSAFADVTEEAAPAAKRRR